MPRSLFFTIVSVLLASIWAQDCNNPLLNTFNLTGLSAPESGSGLAFCSSLQDGQTCCSADTVNSFQSLLETTTNQLQSIAGARDTYLVQLRNNYLSLFESLVTTLQSYSSDIDTITAQNATLGANLTNETSIFTGINSNLTSIDNDFNGALRAYQAARATCFETLLEVQAATWCLACDPNYATNGVLANGTIVFSDGICNSISSTCYPFLQGASGFNPLIQARESFERLQNLTVYLGQFDNTGILPNSTIEASSWSSPNSTELTVAIPDGCTGPDDCQWQCNNLFPGGVLNQTIAANGAGVLGGDDVAFDTLGLTADNSSNSTNTTDNGVEAVVGAASTAEADSTNATNATDATNATNTTSASAAEVNSTNATNATDAANATNTTSARRNATRIRRRRAVNNTSRLLQQDNTFSPNLQGTGLDTTVARDPAGIFAVGTNADNLEESIEEASVADADVNPTPVVVTNTTTTPNSTNSTTVVANVPGNGTAVVAPENGSNSTSAASGNAVADDTANFGSRIMVGVVCMTTVIVTVLF